MMIEATRDCWKMIQKESGVKCPAKRRTSSAVSPTLPCHY